MFGLVMTFILLTELIKQQSGPIYENHMKPNEKWKKSISFEFFTGNGSGDTEGHWIWQSRCLWMLPVCSGCRIRWYSKKSQNLEVIMSPRKRSSQKWCFYRIKTTNRKDENDRKDHEKISCFHQNLSLWWYLPLKLMFSWKPGFSFSVRLINFIMKSCSGSRVPR